MSLNQSDLSIAAHVYPSNIPICSEEGETFSPNEVVEQIAFADILLLNKSDLVDADKLDNLDRRVRFDTKTPRFDIYK